jgi:methyl-accepting chemotaxis protein
VGWFKNIGIAPKIFSIIALLGLLAAGLSTLGIRSLSTVYSETATYNRTFEMAVNTGRATSNLLSYARYVEFLPLDLSKEDREKYEKAATDESRRLESRLAVVDKMLVAEAGRQNMAKMREAISRYARAHAQVVELSRKGDFKKAGEVAEEAADVIEIVRKEMREIEDRNANFVKEATAAILGIYESSRTTMLTATGVGVLVGLGLALVIVLAGITRPLGRMTVAMGEVAGGNLDIAVPSLGQKDEVGRLAAALEKFKEAGMENRRLQADQKEAEKRAEVEKKKALNSMADSFEASVKGVVQGVSSAATQMQSSAQSMSSTAEETQRQATAVAAASEQASTNVQTVASAAEELSSSIAEISRQVAESTKIAGKAVEDAGHTNDKVQALAEAAQKIGDVVKLINDIAGQTNLLALNATIEAARAGEAGRPDQPAGAQRHDRGGARRRSRQGLRGRRFRGQVVGQPDCQGDRRDRRADRRHPGCHRRSRHGDQADRRDHRPGKRDRHHHRLGGGGAGGGDAGDRPQRAAGFEGDGGGVIQHRRRHPGRDRYRPDLERGAERGRRSVEAVGAPARRGGSLPRYDPRRLIFARTPTRGAGPQGPAPFLSSDYLIPRRRVYFRLPRTREITRRRRCSTSGKSHT